MTTNARRLALGMSPFPPVRRATEVTGKHQIPYKVFIALMSVAAKRSRTSPKPGNHMENSCNTGTVCCCALTLSSRISFCFSFVPGNSLFEAKHSFAHHLSGVLGVDVPANALVGDGCSPMSIGAISGNQW